MKIVITTWGSFGDLHPYMALAMELKRRGHLPVIATIPSYKEKVERVGIAFHAVRPDFPPPDQIVEVIRRAVDVREGSRYIFSRMIAPHLRETYEDTLAAVQADGGADLIVSHMATIGMCSPDTCSRSRMRRVASRPPISGICTSIRIRSKLSCSKAATTARPSLATTTLCPSFSNRRTANRWSSARRFPTNGVGSCPTAAATNTPPS